MIMTSNIQQHLRATCSFFGDADPYRVIATLVDLGMNNDDIARYFGVDTSAIRKYQTVAVGEDGASFPR